jgi:hypothetical protein
LETLGFSHVSENARTSNILNSVVRISILPSRLWILYCSTDKHDVDDIRLTRSKDIEDVVDNDAVDEFVDNGPGFG